MWTRDQLDKIFLCICIPIRTVIGLFLFYRVEQLYANDARFVLGPIAILGGLDQYWCVLKRWWRGGEDLGPLFRSHAWWRPASLFHGTLWILTGILLLAASMSELARWLLLADVTIGLVAWFVFKAQDSRTQRVLPGRVRAHPECPE